MPIIFIIVIIIADMMFILAAVAASVIIGLAPIPTTAGSVARLIDEHGTMGNVLPLGTAPPYQGNRVKEIMRR